MRCAPKITRRRWRKSGWTPNGTIKPRMAARQASRRRTDMTTTASQTPASSQPHRLSGAAWGLALVPLVLLGIVLTYLVVTGGGLTELAGPPVEQIAIQRVILPEPGIIQIDVVNDGPQEVTIPQI